MLHIPIFVVVAGNFAALKKKTALVYKIPSQITNHFEEPSGPTHQLSIASPSDQDEGDAEAVGDGVDDREADSVAEVVPEGVTVGDGDGVAVVEAVGLQEEEVVAVSEGVREVDRVGV